MYKKYTTSLPFYGMWGSRKTSWDGPANKKNKKKDDFGLKQYPFYVTVWSLWLIQTLKIF